MNNELRDIIVRKYIDPTPVYHGNVGIDIDVAFDINKKLNMKYQTIIKKIMNDVLVIVSELKMKEVRLLTESEHT